ETTAGHGRRDMRILNLQRWPSDTSYIDIFVGAPPHEPGFLAECPPARLLASSPSSEDAFSCGVPADPGLTARSHRGSTISRALPNGCIVIDCYRWFPSPGRYFGHVP